MTSPLKTVPIKRLYLCLSALVIAIMLISLLYGSADLTILDILTGLVSLNDDPASLIVWEIRMPRILLSAIIGFTLGLAGAALQGYLRNPLADAGILGVSASSGFGAILAIYYGLAAINSYFIPLTALGAAIISTMAILFLARRDTSMVTLILAGLAISSLMGSLSSLALSLAPTPMSLQDMMMWLMGSLTNSSWAEIWLVLPFMLLGAILILSIGNNLSALTLGRDVAQSMGVDILAVRRRLILGIALVVSSGVAVAGMIGFIGLIVPHVVRPFTGYDPAKSLIPSGLAGAGLLLLADMIARTPIFDSEIRIGVMTSLIGAPAFLWILIKTRRERR